MGDLSAFGFLRLALHEQRRDRPGLALGVPVSAVAVHQRRAGVMAGFGLGAGQTAGRDCARTLLRVRARADCAMARAWLSCVRGAALRGPRCAASRARGAAPMSRRGVRDPRRIEGARPLATPSGRSRRPDRSRRSSRWRSSFSAAARSRRGIFLLPARRAKWPRRWRPRGRCGRCGGCSLPVRAATRS